MYRKAPAPTGRKKGGGGEMGRSGYSSIDEAIHKTPTQHLVCFSEDKPQKFDSWGAGLFLLSVSGKLRWGGHGARGTGRRSLEQAVT